MRNEKYAIWPIFMDEIGVGEHDGDVRFCQNVEIRPNAHAQ